MRLLIAARLAARQLHDADGAGPDELKRLIKGVVQDLERAIREAESAVQELGFGTRAPLFVLENDPDDDPFTIAEYQERRLLARLPMLDVGTILALKDLEIGSVYRFFCGADGLAFRRVG